MKFPNKIEIYVESVIINEIGGYEKVETLYGIVDGYLITPNRHELTIQDGKIISSTLIKVFIKDELPPYVHHIIADGIKYNVTQQCDYTKVKMLIVERVG